MNAEEKQHAFKAEPSTGTYRKGCRCSGCRAENAKYQREYQARRKARAS